MIIFSDIPDFILDTYIDGIQEETITSIITSDVIGTNVLFVDTTSTTFTDTGFVNWNLTYTIGDKASQTNSYLRGPKNFILTKGGERIEAFVEEETEYTEIGLKALTSFKHLAEGGYGSYYDFEILNEAYPVESDTILYTLTASSTGSQAYTKYEFVQYDCYSNPTYKTIENKIGQPVFFRKGSIFHEGGKELYNEHINFNKDFMFIGNIYPFESAGRCRIFKYSLKDFVVRLLPFNNRTDKLTKFLFTSFDEVYNKIYKQQKNLKTLYDGSESEIEYLGDLSRGLYNVDITTYGISKEGRLRDLVRNMPIILKKKGTYSSLIGVGKFITGFDSLIDNRDINIYEWGHNTLPFGTYTVPTSGFAEINYLHQYPSSIIGNYNPSYYSKYSVTDYPDFYQTNIYTTETNCYIHKETTASTTGDVKHGINEDALLIQCFDNNFQEMQPANVEIVDNSACKLTFNQAVAGYCVICKANYGELHKGSYWDITHYINQKMVLSQSFTTFNQRFSPINIYKQDYDNVIITTDTDENDGYGYFLEGDYIYHSRTDQTTWTVNHNINALLLVQCFDSDNNQIIPMNIDQSNFKTITITFNQAVSGYMVLKRIGNPITDTLYTGNGTGGGNSIITDGTVGLILSPHYKIETDLTLKPIDTNDIFSQETSENLYDTGETIRSADRVAHYHNVFSPLVDFSGNTIGTYSQRYTPYCLSTCVINDEFSDNVAIHSQTTETSEGNIHHNLKSSNLLVYIYDTDYNLLYPESTTFVDTFNVSIGFNGTKSGHVVLIKADLIDYDDIIVHTGTRNIISQFYALDRNIQVFPETITNNINQLDVVGQNEDGVAYLIEGTMLGTQTTSASEGTINHNLGSNGVAVEFYDTGWEKIIPSTFTLLDSDTCSATFSEAILGYCVLRNTGFINYRDDIITDVLANGCVIKLGDGTDKSYIDTVVTDVQNETLSMTVDASDCYLYGTNLYIDIELDNGLNTDYDIREIGIFKSDEDVMYFYTQCSQVYKNPNFTMTLHYSINYENI